MYVLLMENHGRHVFVTNDLLYALSQKFILNVTVKSQVRVRACSHERGTVNYPGVMIAPRQALPRVHMMICCPGAMLPRVNFIATGQVQRHLITTKLSEFL